MNYPRLSVASILNSTTITGSISNDFYIKKLCELGHRYHSKALTYSYASLLVSIVIGYNRVTFELADLFSINIPLLC